MQCYRHLWMSFSVNISKAEQRIETLGFRVASWLPKGCPFVLKTSVFQPWGIAVHPDCWNATPEHEAEYMCRKGAKSSSEGLKHVTNAFRTRCIHTTQCLLVDDIVINNRLLVQCYVKVKNTWLDALFEKTVTLPKCEVQTLWIELCFHYPRHNNNFLVF